MLAIDHAAIEVIEPAKRGLTDTRMADNARLPALFV